MREQASTVLSEAAHTKLSRLQESVPANPRNLRLYLDHDAQRFQFVRDVARPGDVSLELDFGELLIDRISLRRLGKRWLDYQLDANGNGRFLLVERDGP